jgi:hypothetical protein
MSLGETSLGETLLVERALGFFRGNVVRGKGIR